MDHTCASGPSPVPTFSSFLSKDPMFLGFSANKMKFKRVKVADAVREVSCSRTTVHKAQTSDARLCSHSHALLTIVINDVLVVAPETGRHCGQGHGRGASRGGSQRTTG